jgi:hypothetical protein
MWIGNMSKKKMSNNQKNQAPQNPYLIDKLAKIPASVKIGFLKFWLAGASFYMTVLALPQAFDWLDRLVALALLFALGIEYVSQTIIMWMNNDKQPTLYYLAHEVNRKSIKSLGATLLYAFIVVIMFHYALLLWVDVLMMPTIGEFISQSVLDPFSFGIFFYLIDRLWIFIRNSIKTKKIG